MVSIACELGGAGEQAGGQAAPHRLCVLAGAADLQLRLRTQLQQLTADLHRVSQVALVQVVLPTPLLWEGGGGWEVRFSSREIRREKREQ